MLKRLYRDELRTLFDIQVSIATRQINLKLG